MSTGLPKTKWNLKSHNGLENSTQFKIVLDETNSQNNTGTLFQGDNLDVLKHLSFDSKYRGGIKLIYIDPPYSTNSIFKTRDLKNGYTDTVVGAEYLEFLRQRLTIMKDLLSEDGSIYVHLDQNMAFNAKVLMDEIFGASNFVNFIIRQKCKPKNFTKKSFGNICDYILFYTKSKKYTWNRQYEKWSDEKIIKEYQYIERETGRRYKKVPIHAPGTRNGETGKEWRGMFPPIGKHWQYIPAKLEKFDKEGKIYWSKNGTPRRKVYLDESLGISVQYLWLNYIDSNNQNTKTTGYPTEKNPELLKRIILASSNENDLVLDCFAGSGTTLDVAWSLKRNWIGVDNSQEAISTILNRLKNGMERIRDYDSKKDNKIKAQCALFEEVQMNYLI